MKKKRQMSSQMKKKNMKRQSLSELQIFMLYRIPWRTSDFRFWIYREMHARTGSRPRTCYEPFKTSCHQLQELLQYLLHDVLSIFTPLALFLYFRYPHTMGGANFEFGGTICAHFVFNYAIYFNYGFTFFC
jgi:hypothetical protein